MLVLSGMMTGLLLASCAQQTHVGSLSDTQMVSAEKAFAYPGPGGPAITGIIERQYANALQQEIALSTSAHSPGQNMLRVQLFGPVDRKVAGQTELRAGFLPPSNIGTEMRQLFPGVRMTRSPYYVQNRYGPFGYAVGRSSSGDTCLYAWQRLTSTGSTQTLIGNKGSIQIRLRLCDQALPEERLLQAMYDFTISSYFRSSGWNPYGAVNAPDASLGKSGAPVYPTASEKFATVTTSPVREAPSVERVVRPRHIAPAPQRVPALPEPTGPIVPPPPGTATSQAETRLPTALVRQVPTASQPAVIVPPPPCDPVSSNCKQ
ncbi:cellulose biosynthesis protein BcsN [Mesorhizobium sp. NPDC059025]|uniref:cellulose biosynthesis protein BcsN n=1 Tax=unclassified Mesorhizobium TaxID=325217 RepID=UPI0036A95687